MPKLRLLPSEARRRGLPSVGFDMVLADGVTTAPPLPGLFALLTEHRPDGRRLGTMTVEVVAAGLIIDRDGTLAHLANEHIPDAVPYAVRLDAGANGFRADIVRADRGELPYHSQLAIGPLDVGGTGAVIISIEAAVPEWPAATAMLATLRVFSRDGDARAVTQDVNGAASLALPLVKPSGA